MNSVSWMPADKLQQDYAEMIEQYENSLPTDQKDALHPEQSTDVALRPRSTRPHVPNRRYMTESEPILAPPGGEDKPEGEEV